MFKWRQEGNRVFLKEPKGEIYFIVPDDFKLSETSQDLLRLIEYTLFSPFYKSEFNKTKLEKSMGSRNPGEKIGHSFSTGLDSTAAMLLLPDYIILYYHERSDYLGGQLDQDNAFRMIKAMDRKVYRIKSDHERIPVFHNAIRGSFSTDMACCAGLILLSDYLDLGYISTGTMLGSTYVRKGFNYQDFKESEYWIRWSHLFSLAGLTLMFPVAGASEVITNEIVQKSKYKNLSHSCLRGWGGKGCNFCYKCFRKNLLNGIISPISDEVLHHLTSRPLKQGDSMIYAMQKSGESIEQLDEYINTEIDWSERFYLKGLELVPDKFRDGIVKKIKEFEIEMMNPEDIKNMKEFDIR